MKRHIGTLVILLAVVLTVIVWFVFPPLDDGRPNFERQYAGEIIGSINIVLMSFALFLSTRPKWAEPYFGGLDKMYVTHRQLATAALLLIFVHVLTVPISLSGWALGNYLAVVAFVGIVSIALVSLAPRVAFLNKLTGGTYEGWKNLKRFIGIFFILGFIHSLTIGDPLDAFIAINWVQLFFILGTISYLYTEVFGRFFKKYLPYKVEAVNHPNALTTEVTMRAKKEPIKRQRAGQFLFVRFPGEKSLDESHPFTISSAPQEDVLRVTIKASGDFTRRLFDRLQPNMEAVVEGAYGMFDYRTGGQKQIWIAGGIGLTPFLSFIRAMDSNLGHDVDFYYTVRHPEEALFVDEIRAAAERNPRLKPHVRYSATEGSLRVEDIVRNTVGDIRNYHIYLCGPLPMIQAFERKFSDLGVPAENIHYEEFNFR
ncbi:MAG TPA: ferric reductase-like transmembrane domain-containing protein [Anaerolineales bacterium]|nr:ferric reductase-like transmembrane domain-containing protein [Anaerolineales bacterium]